MCIRDRMPEGGDSTLPERDLSRFVNKPNIRTKLGQKMSVKRQTRVWSHRTDQQVRTKVITIIVQQNRWRPSEMVFKSERRTRPPQTTRSPVTRIHRVVQRQIGLDDENGRTNCTWWCTTLDRREAPNNSRRGRVDTVLSSAARKQKWRLVI